MARKFVDWLRTLGAPEDPVATDTSSDWSAMSLLKAIYGQIAGGGLQAGLVAALSGSSTSSVAIGTGAKSFTTQTSKAFSPGMWLNIASDADEANFMNGPVTSYDAGTGALVMSIDNIGGSGTFADWIISLSGTQGPSATVTIGIVTTVAPGQPATVADVGAPGATVLNFGIPEGIPGAYAPEGTPSAGRIAVFGTDPDTQLADGGAAISTDGTLASNSDAKVPTEKAVKTYADALIAANDAMVFKGVIDCSANPNYPAADRGHTYRVSVAGKIGGGSGPNVEIGDILMCLTDATSAGNHATVGANWSIIQVNIDGALTTSSIGVSVQPYDAATAKLNVENQTLTGGVEVTSKALNGGSAVTSGTLTLDMADRPLQHYTNGGAHTFAPGSVAGACMVDITNNGSAGAITTSGWTKVVGSFTTTNAHKFRCHASVGNGGSLLIIQALQ